MLKWRENKKIEGYTRHAATALIELANTTTDDKNGGLIEVKVRPKPIFFYECDSDDEYFSDPDDGEEINEDGDVRIFNKNFTRKVIL